jgi:YHS domain-containing protein
MRAILYLAALLLLVLVLAPLVRALTRATRPAARATRRDELVKDPVCQTYIVKSRALAVQGDGGVAHFCSRECAARFARGERRR